MTAFDSATENVSSIKCLSNFSTYLLNPSLALDEAFCMLDNSRCNILFSRTLVS